MKAGFNNFASSQLGLKLARKSRADREVVIGNFVRNNNLSRDNILREIGYLKSDWNKRELAREWLIQDGRSVEDLESALNIFTDKHDKFLLAKEWIIQGGRSAEDLGSALTLFTAENHKFRLASEWIIQDGRSAEDLEPVLSLFLPNKQQPHKR